MSESRISNLPHPLRLGLLMFGLAVLVRLMLFFVAGLPFGGFIPDYGPFAGDFTSFYTASQLAQAGTPALAYDIPAHKAAQIALWGDKTGYFFFFYPPMFLLLCYPFAFVSYLWAVGLWIFTTGAFYAVVMKRYAQGTLGYPMILAFAGVAATIGAGQNALLSTGLMGLGILVLKRNPVLAGIAFGLMAYKPHLGLILPFVLIAAQQWRALIAGGVTALAFALASVMAFGAGAWHGFIAGSKVAFQVLETDAIGDGGMMMSVFGAFNSYKLPLWLSWGTHILIACGVIAITSWFFWRARNIDIVAPMIAMGTLLITPFVLSYDLALYAIPMVWLYRHMQRDGALPGESALLTISFLWPWFAAGLSSDYGLPLTPLLSLALFACLVRRALRLMKEDAPA